MMSLPFGVVMISVLRPGLILVSTLYPALVIGDQLYLGSILKSHFGLYGGRSSGFPGEGAGFSVGTVVEFLTPPVAGSITMIVLLPSLSTVSMVFPIS